MRCGAYCSCCCLLLTSIGCAQPTSQWLEQTKADDPAKRLQAVHVLQEKRSEAATVVPALIESLKDTNTYVRRDAARALGLFGPDAHGAITPLIERLRDQEPSVRKAAGQSLRQIDPSAAAKAGVR